MGALSYVFMAKENIMSTSELDWKQSCLIISFTFALTLAGELVEKPGTIVSRNGFVVKEIEI